MNEDYRTQHEVHVAGVALRNFGNGVKKLLLCKRSNNKIYFPGMWECCGGRLPNGMSFENSVKEIFRKELGMSVDVMSTPVTYWFIGSKGVIPGVRFLCRTEDDPVLGEDHTVYKWVDINNLHTTVLNDGIIPGLLVQMYRLAHTNGVI